jgi:nucleotide-binding universal stress UspA family protein
MFILMLKRIVVGYAGDEAGRDAVKLGVELAVVLDSAVTIVYPYHPLLAPLPAEIAEARVKEELKDLLSGIDAERRVDYHSTSSPWPIHGLHELASCEDADLIVFGAARGRLADHLQMSLIERMVHGAPCAVAVAPPGYAERDPGAPRRIGVGFSDAEEGRTALLVAYKLAESVDGELEVIAASGLGASLTAYAFSSALLPQIEEEIYAETETKLEQLVADLGERVPIHLDVRRGDPCGALSARSEHLDLLILGSRAYGPLRHALLGSVSASVIRTSHCPVLVVPRGMTERLEDALGETEANATLSV